MQAKRALFLLCLAELFGMTVWFSVSAIAPALQRDFSFSGEQIADMVLSLQFGFVIGTLVIAFANLADVFNTRRLFALFAVFAAATNLALIWLGDVFALAMLLRFATGFALAGVYPPGMKIIAGWFRKGRGAAIGALIGALTIGSALPHWLGGFMSQRWQLTIWVSSGLALLGAAIVAFRVEDGPYDQPARNFKLNYVVSVMKYRPTRLAYFGYFGHMWELYAMWAWLPVFLAQAMPRDGAGFGSHFWTFAIIASGAAGCVAYGFWADRIGRSKSTITAMAVSGVCCFVIGLLPAANLTLLLTVCLIWGVTIVADSAQFSAAVSELCEPEYLGTALTLQTSIGFLITMASIRLVPLLQVKFGWAAAFAMLGIGPMAGIVAMALLLRTPAAAQMAGGRG